MSVKAICEEIMDTFYGDEEQENDLFNYLIGESEKEPSSLSRLNVRTFNVLHNQENLTEKKQILIKLFRVLMKKNEKVLLQIIQGPKKYEILKAAEVTSKLIKQDLVNILTKNFRWSGYYSYLPIDINQTVKGMWEFYPDVAEQLVKNCKGINGILQVGAMLLMAEQLNQEKMKGSVSQQNDKQKEMEQIVTSMLTGLFGKEKINTIYKEEQYKVVCKEQYLQLEPYQLGIDKVSFPMILYCIFLLCGDCSKYLQESYRIFIMLVSPDFLYQKYNNNNSVFHLYDKLSVPDETRINYCCYRLIQNRDADRMQHYRILEDIMKKDITKFQETVTMFWKEKKDSFLILLALLFKNHMLTKEEEEQWLEKAENNIIDRIQKIQSKEHVFTFTEKEMESFEFLREEEDSSPEVTSLNYSIYEEEKKKLTFNCIFLLDYSKVANNFMKLILKYQYRYMIYSIDFFQNYELFCQDSIKNVYQKLYEDRKFSLETVCILFFSHFHQIDKDKKRIFLQFLLKNKKKAEQGIEKFSFESSDMVEYLNLLYKTDNGFDYTCLTKTFGFKAKSVANCAEQLLKTKEDVVRPAVEALLEAKNKATRDTAMRLIRIWDNNKIEEELDKICDLDTLTAYIETKYTKSNEKNVPFAKEIDYASVRAKDSEEKVSEILTKFYISEYLLLKDYYLIKICKKIQDFVNIYDFRALIKNIFEMWISEGANAKYKNLLFPVALTAGEGQISDLKKQIDFWADNSKPALAAFAVQALCMNGSKMALLLVDTMSKKHKNKKVKSAAIEALDSTAERMEISREELDDMIVPDLGFDKNGIRIFHYGERDFQARLNMKLEVTLFDQEGKQIKSLPKASAKYHDNEDLANSCKEALKVVKKQLKLVLDSQTPRISKAVMTGRKWTIERWKSLFVENPIMHSFATALIWEELDEKGNIKKTFRYMEDGSFNTVEEEECEIEKDSFITPLHPADIEKEELDQWIEQLEDYEIIQPVDQVAIPVMNLTQEEKELKQLKQFQGKKVYGATFKSMISKLGMSPEFDGYSNFAGCSYTDEESEITLKIHTSSFYPSDYSAVIEIGVMEFCKTIRIEHNVNETQMIPLGTVPPKLLSLAMMVGNKITAKVIENKEE